MGLHDLAGVLALVKGLPLMVTAATLVVVFMAAAATFVAFFVVAALMAFAVVVTVGAGALELAAQVLLNDLVGVAGLTCTQVDAGGSQSVDCTAADTAADEDIDAFAGKEAGERAVALTVGADDFGGDDFAVFDFVDFEVFTVTEVLEHFAVVVGDCDSHNDRSPVLL